MIALDHIAISGNTLDEASDYISSRLGVNLQNGGSHHFYGTHNRLLNLCDEVYLEAVAINPLAKKPSYPRWFNLDNFKGDPRITNWICSTTDLNFELKTLSLTRFEIIRIKRDKFEWDMALPPNGILPFNGAFPALLQWKTNPPGSKLLPSGCRLKHMIIFHPKAGKLQKKLKNFKDSRISFEMHNQVKFFAEFDTPHGSRSLE